ncbi:PhzF family phenazine biosynthesis protein [Branchiibius sp. NY16-3462-2]|uniref:PhzF family phenazine biosynthesis protein n=1 Tax=Branchiibius sp. NY16-3462-2 TaxID=1807500 RepID=UPI000799D7A5|nr:PhzF family phenazine biosynthesis protein [Branchiibius sp. NY16-3462-2]KYH45554.1 phenazine biosynthesis protein PhzF [Branchiibius sp. NY16-3462-2]
MSAFADGEDGGNPAGVVLDAADLSDDQMLRIAQEVGYSETAFVGAVVDEPSGRRYNVRYWSPAAEVPFCGHASVATAVALAERDGVGGLTLATQAGDVAIDTKRDDHGAIQVAMTSVRPEIRDLDPVALDSLLDLLGLVPADLDPRFPPRESFAGNWHPVLVLADREIFNQFRFAPKPVAELMIRQGWTGTITVLREVGRNDFEGRNIFPVGRITEDPATGSAAASVGAYLRSIGYTSPESAITIHQGSHVGRPSLLTVTVPDAGGITVAGSATLL